MAEYQSELTAAESVEQNMKEYGDYTIKSKFPNVYDGLKPIHRRILWRLHQDPKMQKEATLAGSVMKMHPHGDASIASTISSMAQPFNNIIPLVYSDSNIGTYVGDSPAAARYVDVVEAESAEDFFFKDVNAGTFTFVPCESEEGTEPENFIPVIPTTLLINTFGIAIGFKTDTAALAIHDLCVLSKEYVLLRKSPNWRDKLNTLIKYMIPDFPTSCAIRNSDMLLSAYRRGEFSYPIITDGTAIIKNDRIIIETIPYGKSFGEITMRAGMLTRVKDSWINQHFQQLEDFSDKKQGIHKGQFNCIVRRGENPFDLLADLKKALGFTYSWKPSRLYVGNDGLRTEETPFTLLDKWYTDRYRSVLGELKQKLNKLIARHRELLALVIIADHADEVYKIFRNAETKEDTIPILCKRFKLTLYQAKFISNLTLAQMTHRGRNDLLNDIEKNKQDIKDLQYRFINVDVAMIESIDKIDKKYSPKYPRKCVIPKYIGNVCYRDNGFMQIESMEEVEKILHYFDPELLTINLYDKGSLVSLGFDSEGFIDLPKQFKADYVSTFKGTPEYTACVTHKGSLLVEGLACKQGDAEQVVPISNRFIGINKQGYLMRMTVDKKYLRKSINTSPSMPDIIHVSNIDDDDVIVVHVNEKEPNIIRIDRRSGASKLSKIVVGKWHVVGVYKVNKPFVIPVPSNIRNRCSVRHVYVDNASNYVSEGSTLVINLNKKTSGNCYVQLMNKRSLMHKLMHQ